MESIFSKDRMYRYTLWREWSDDLFQNRTHEGYVMFIGLNPSTADEKTDDPTLRRCIDFTKRWGFLKLCMTNLFAFRATDPNDMKCAADPIGIENNTRLIEVGKEAAMVVAAWGNHGLFNNRAGWVLKMMGDCKIPLYCLRLTKHKQPEHPLYLPAKTKPFLYL